MGAEYSEPSVGLASGVTIDRLATPCRSYLEKEALAEELPAFAQAFTDHLASLSELPDVIHAHFADAVGVALQAKRLFGIPVVYTPHALGIDKWRQDDRAPAIGGRIAAERHALASADAIIVSSRQEASEQVRAYGVELGARVHCIPPGVPQRQADAAESRLVEQLEERFAEPGKRIILAIARPVRKKNIAALLRAYAAKPALMARANLVILAGQSDGRHSSVEERQVVDELRRICATPDLRHRVALPPTHGEADVVALYRRAAAGGVFVNPALHEPFGLTLIEAAAAGVPVVATRHGGPAEIVETLGHGLLVDPSDEAAIGDACLDLLSDANRHARLASAPRDRIDHYSWANYAEHSVALYASLRRRPRLLVCDIDGTLTGCETGARAFAAWRAERQLPFVVATGRSFPAARSILRNWHLPQPDAYIVDVGTRIMLPVPNGAWRECPLYAQRLAEGWDRAAVMAVLDGLPLTPQPPATNGPYKLSYFGGRRDAEVIQKALVEAGLQARVIHSHGRLIDVLAPGGGKAAAIAAYAGQCGMTLADCAAAGDSGNDLDMLDACGHAIVVGNADADLDGLRRRHGLRRVAARHAAGVMEGLAALGLGPAEA
ncbi:glycosyltransferase [Belnapia sp. T18]|uniref:sucrose-phosphate synthase n=1 Tax=Belnapia arida TaxID=2804533 RepID=A0ABS1UEJ5_9PROT|nr:glycosyltransferase [Belnapia arida]